MILRHNLDGCWSRLSDVLCWTDSEKDKRAGAQPEQEVKHLQGSHSTFPSLVLHFPSCLWKIHSSLRNRLSRKILLQSYSKLVPRNRMGSPLELLCHHLCSEPDPRMYPRLPQVQYACSCHHNGGL